MEEAEREHFDSIIQAFKEYRGYTLRWIHRREEDWNSAPSHYRELLHQDMQHKFQSMRTCAKHNGHFIDLLLSDHLHIFQNIDHQEEEEDEANEHSHESHNTIDRSLHHQNMEKVKTTLRQFVRDWSAEGSKERNQCYGPILQEMANRFPIDESTGSSRKDVRVLCPGAGLGRLCLDLTSMGFSCEGNEFSYFMLIASNFILNKTRRANEFTIFPFIHQNVNVLHTADQMRSVTVPDVLPQGMIAPDVDFSMCAGEFVETYRDQRKSWDSIVTCFFLDTAKNIIEYVETISTILKDGGVWINNGPLLYHFADTPDTVSVELSYEQLKRVILHHGFAIEKESICNSSYTSNPRSMMNVVYHSVFFVATKISVSS